MTAAPQHATDGSTAVPCIRSVRDLPVRVFIADDHEVVCEGLRLILGGDARLEVVGAVGTGHRAVTGCARLQPDIVLVECGLPDMAAAELCRRLRDVAPRARVIVLSAHVTPDRV